MAIVIGRAPPPPQASPPSAFEAHARPHPRLLRLAREVGAEGEVVLPLATQAAPGRCRSYWYHFTGSMDQPRDVAILKELIFWASVRHQDDTLLRVVHAAPEHEDFVYHQKAFGVTESPCLVMSDRGELPASHVKLGKDFFAPEVIGSDYAALWSLLETMHSLLSAHGMEKVRSELTKLTVSPQPS